MGRLTSGSTIRTLIAKLLFHGLDLGAEHIPRADVLIHRDPYADPLTVLQELLSALVDQPENGCPFAFDNSVHRRQLVPEPAFLDQLDDARDILGEVRAFVEWNHAERNEHILSLLWDIACDEVYIKVDEFQNIATESFDAVLAEAREFGLCLTMAHQSLKQLDDRLVSLILGNAQTQIYFRVSRQDAERLAKEPENIAKKFAGRGDEIMQEMEHKFTLAELWKKTFHNLSRLEFRKAYVMIKGVFDHPELIRTTDTPFIEQDNFPFSDEYTTLDNLDSSYKARKEKIESVLKDYAKKDKKRPESKDDEKPP